MASERAGRFSLRCNMAIDGKLTSEEVRIFTRTIDDVIVEFNDNIEKYEAMPTSRKIDWIVNQIVFWRNGRSALVLLKSRIKDLER